MKNLEEQKERQKRAEVRRAKLQVKIDIATKYLKYLVKPLLAGSVVFAAYWIYKLVFYFASKLTLAVIISGAWVLAQAVVLVVGTTLIVLALWKGFGYVSCRLNAIPTPKIEGKFTLIDKVFGAIYEGFSFIKETIVMTYKKECPLIDWDSEDGPIEKIKKD